MRLKNPRPEEMEEVRGKLKVLVSLGIFPFLMLLSLLWYRQIIQGDKYKELSQRNYIRLRRRWLSIRRLPVAPGSHLFQVKAIDSEGLESENKSISFRK